MPKISVIVPVYNGEKYLKQAFDSLMNQSFHDFEVILVNDGSTNPECLNILQEYIDKDERFCLINQENQGSGQARNTGLKHAKSEYITFFDPDDFLGKDYLEVLYKEITKTNADLVEIPYQRIYEETGTTKNVKLKLLQENIDYTKDFNEDYLFSLSYATWNKIYKRELIENHGLAFLEKTVHEDVLFTIKARFFAKKIRFVNVSPQYFYRVRGNSVSNMKNKFHCTGIGAIKKVLDFLEEQQYYKYHKKSVEKGLVKLIMFSYVRIPYINKIKYIKETKKLMPKNIYNQFIKIIIKTELNNIFSVRNIEENGKKYKSLNIFWQRYKIKELPTKE